MTKLSKIKLKPGLHRESTQYEEEGNWFDGDHVRFRAGKPENMRGYETKVSTAFDGSAIKLPSVQQQVDKSNKQTTDQKTKKRLIKAVKSTK